MPPPPRPGAPPRPFRFPLTLKLRASRRLRWALALLHALVAVAFLQASSDWRIRIPALFLVVLSFLLSWRSEGAKAGRVLVLQDDGLLGIPASAGSVEAYPLPGCTDFGWAIWLQWRTKREGWRLPRGGALMLLPDHLPPESWRPLRAWLRHKADTVGPEEARPERR